MCPVTLTNSNYENPSLARLLGPYVGMILEAIKIYCQSLHKFQALVAQLFIREAIVTTLFTDLTIISV